MRFVFRAMICAALTGLGCSEIPHSQLDLSLEARPAEFAARVDGFEIRLWAGRYGTPLEPVTSRDGTTIELPVIIPLVPADDDADREFTVEAEIFEGGRSLGTQRVIGRFTQNQRRRLSLVFRAECETVLCQADERCGADGRCEPACFEYQDGEPVAIMCESVPSEGPCVVCDGDVCTPRPASENCFDGIALGAEHGCASSAGELLCWGTNSDGQLGQGDTQRETMPALVDAPGGGPWTYFEAGGNASCGVVVDALWCWGVSAGDATTVTNLAPTAVSFAPSSGWSQFSLATGWLCGMHADGLSCRGVGEGLLTPGDFGSDWRMVDTSGTHICGLDGGGHFNCWGRNNEGQTGRGTLVGGLAAPRPSPDPDTEYLSVATSFGHSCGVTDTGFVLCWGINLQGQLGTEDDGDPRCATRRCSPDPVQVAMEGWTAVAVGSAHSCGIRAGEVYCWGSNSAGQLGIDAPTAMLAQPTRISGPDLRWTAIAAAEEQTCALSDRGELHCWGNNGGGRLGIPPTGSPDILRAPLQVTR